VVEVAEVTRLQYGAVMETRGYCSNCGEWQECQTVIVASIPEKLCAKCRER
jgi:hypothetical protein